jgi:hypothetical protein
MTIFLRTDLSAKPEEAYARHCVCPGKRPFHPPASKNSPARSVNTGQEVQVGSKSESESDA